MAKPGPKPIPNAVKQLKGGRKTYHYDIGKPDPVSVRYSRRPPPPGHLDKVAKTEWKRMVELMYTTGQMTKLDKSCLELYCAAYSTWRRAQEILTKEGLMVETPNGYPIQSPYLAIVNKQQSIIVKLLAEMGGTPSSRTRVDIPKEPEKDEFTDFMKHGGQPYEVT